ncbi:MAG TPA: YraN family protein [Bacillota bacterium]|nr:YraN family protein [Bacillota bacterium]
MNRTEKGRLGEELAAADMESKGYIILVKNFRCKAGEIDIVAKRGNVMVFVEVKTRTGKDYGSPAEAVGSTKRCHMIKAAAFYMQKFNIRGMDMRFDVAEIYVNHLENTLI